MGLQEVLFEITRTPCEVRYTSQQTNSKLLCMVMRRAKPAGMEGKTNTLNCQYFDRNRTLQVPERRFLAIPVSLGAK